MAPRLETSSPRRPRIPFFDRRLIALFLEIWQLNLNEFDSWPWFDMLQVMLLKKGSVMTWWRNSNTVHASNFLLVLALRPVAVGGLENSRGHVGHRQPCFSGESKAPLGSWRIHTPKLWKSHGSDHSRATLEVHCCPATLALTNRESNFGSKYWTFENGGSWDAVANAADHCLFDSGHVLSYVNFSILRKPHLPLWALTFTVIHCANKNTLSEQQSSKWIKVKKCQQHLQCPWSRKIFPCLA